MDFSMKGMYPHLDAHLAPVGSLLSRNLGLPHFEAHFTTFFLSFAAFSILHPLSSYVISPALFPKSYKSLDKRTKYHWDTHVVSMVHACIVGPWALRLCNVAMPNTDNNRTFGWDERLGPFHAFAAAYFLWDTLETIYSRADIAFVIHGMACLILYMCGYRPFFAFFGARALTWELSTPFLNIHWFIDKAKMTGSKVQLINGVILLAVFFCVRIIFGAITSYWFLCTLYEVRTQVPWVVMFIFVGGMIVLNTLNIIWFSKMIAALKKRFPASAQPEESRRPITNRNSITMVGPGAELKAEVNIIIPNAY